MDEKPPVVVSAIVPHSFPIRKTKLDRKPAGFDIPAAACAKLYIFRAKRDGPVCRGRFFALRWLWKRKGRIPSRNAV
jgi:hypothetical protein